MGRGAKTESSRGKVATAIKQKTIEPDSAAENAGARGPENAQPTLTPEARGKLAEIRSHIETSVGQIVLMLMQAPRYRHHSLADLNHLIIEPLLRDRIAIAFAKTGEADTSANRPPEGMAFWASVDEMTDARIQEQVKAGVFPVRLSSDEWASARRCGCSM